MTENSRVAQVEQRASADGGVNPSSVSIGKRETWPHVGNHGDSLHIRVNGKTLALEFRPHCPRCRHGKHPQVTRARDHQHERHCNRCHIRWTNPDRQPFSASYGRPDGRFEHLFYGLYGKDYPKNDGWLVATAASQD